MNISKDKKELFYDLAIVGGGINGAGIAADASGRGLKVFLCEQNDLASGTSSASSKLIHGGLRYLEHYEFRLVKEALAEREVLLNKAPHLVSPLKFVMPHRPHLRPAWMIRCGLFMYDHLSKRNTLPKARKVKFEGHAPFKKSITKGFEYHDCWVDDSRLVVLNAIDAHQRGASIEVQSQCTDLMFDNEHKRWRLRIFNKVEQRSYEILAKNVINASGPWLNSFLDNSAKDIEPARNIRLIKGSHIIVPRLEELDEAYILQNEDKRVVFVLPYLEHFSIIGTTDKEYKGKPENVEIEDWEVEYLIKVYNQHFERPISRDDIKSSYSGVRPLCDDESDDPSAITRDYTLELHEETENNALLSIYGGKITTYRKLSEAVMKKIAPYIGEHGKSWTATEPMPGVQFTGQTRQQLQDAIEKKAPWLSNSLVTRYLKAYGTLCFNFLANKEGMNDMGEYFGAGLFAAEVDYLIEQEWARSVEDILWRRSKLGLFLKPEEVEKLQQYVKLRLPNRELNKSASAAA